MSPKKMVCTRPFELLEVGALRSKDAYLCCQGWLTKSVGSALSQSVESLWTNAHAKRIRLSVLNGSFKYCKDNLCPHLSELNGPVKYVGEEEYEQLRQQALEPLGQSPLTPKVINLAHDYSCNLACPSCRKELVVSDSSERKASYELAEKLLTAYGDNIDEIYITGSGDPFGGRVFWDVLTGDLLKRYRRPKIRLHTNAQLFNLDRWNKIPHLHDRVLSVEVSVDAGLESTYAENRRPGCWKTLLKNMEFIRELRLAKTIPLLKVSFVVQKNNWREMEGFVRLAKTWSVDEVLFRPLNNWSAYSAKEYHCRAVQFRYHPEHQQFVEYLKRPTFRDEVVSIGSLERLRAENIIASDA